MSVATANITGETRHLNESQPETDAESTSIPTTMEKDEHHGTNTHKEDPATVAASEELRHTSISDRGKDSAKERSTGAESVVAKDKDMIERPKETTPEREPSDTQDEEMRERLSSPKKKRGRDHDEDTTELDKDNVEEPGSSADGSVVNGGRASRLGPEKKRPRDGSEDRPAEPVAPINPEVSILDLQRYMKRLLILNRLKMKILNRRRQNSQLPKKSLQKRVHQKPNSQRHKPHRLRLLVLDSLLLRINHLRLARSVEISKAFLVVEIRQHPLDLGL
jgi:hypothetical protein